MALRDRYPLPLDLLHYQGRDMSNRRAVNNRIRGPQSALTDFLASNNISAAQINADYERRQAEARRQEEREAAERGRIFHDEGENEEEDRVEAIASKRKRKRQQEKTLAKIKASKKAKGGKKGKGDDSDNENDDWDMYAKRKPLPGQLENCEVCEKRFTVTPYSKTGPDGGLLCTKCSKEQEAEKKQGEKIKKVSVGREKRRQAQSNLLDGVVQIGSKPLQELCVKEVANNINDVEDFGDLPESLLRRLSQILSRRRVITSRTLDLFLRPDLATVDIYDCGKLETEDYIKLFQVMPGVETLNLRNAGQFKDEVVDFMMERDVPIKHLQLEAANLISNIKWIEFFERCGHRLETLKLSWLDYSMDENAFTKLVSSCPNLRRLKLRKCFKLGDAVLGAMAKLKKLEHLSLQFNQPISSKSLAELISIVGQRLLTLSLQSFADADDEVLAAIHSNCRKLRKLRFTENDNCTDAGFAALFSDWHNPPLCFIDLSSNRSVDYSTPDGPDAPIGLASTGLQAVMEHSGSALEFLDISSCRHIGYDAFSHIFSSSIRYPLLTKINISFLTKVDTPVVAGMLTNCPLLEKIVAFGCFNVVDVVARNGVALIGIPTQETLVLEGTFDETSRR